MTLKYFCDTCGKETPGNIVRNLSVFLAVIEENKEIDSDDFMLCKKCGVGIIEKVRKVVQNMGDRT